MAAHRYWRAAALQTYGSAGLELSEFHLLAGTVRVDEPALLASSIAPSEGALPSLKDDDLATSATWSAAAVPMLVLTWDFGAGGDVEVTDIRLGGGGSAVRFLLAARIQYSDDSSSWTDYAVLSGIAWPGIRHKTVSRRRPIDPLKGTVLMMNFDGGVIANEALEGATLTVGSNAALSANARFGTGALQAGGTTPYGSNGVTLTNVKDTYAFGSGDFTVETFFKSRVAGTGVRGLIMNGYAFGPGHWRFVLADGKMQMPALNSSFFSTNTTSAMDGAWHHLAYSRQSGVGRFFFDGAAAGELADTAVYGVGEGVLRIGEYVESYGGNLNPADGFFDCVRVTKGIARYTVPFMPPAAALPQDNPMLIDVSPAAGTSLSGLLRVPTPLSVPMLLGRTSLEALRRGRKDYLTGFLGRGVGRVRGATLDYVNPLNKPYPCRVRLVREVDGLVVRETWSGADGSYDFQWIDELESYTVLAYYQAHGKRAVVADGLTLANGKVEVMP
ncbi:LamG domain-containing protein [Variovorax beijingensis]|uniref:LamG domain-containing protein n=1 Tax=Variovorax beijingensis TaxID=2496117 RepID=A0ABY0A9P2_9BURK|nr:LamG domain-containing protein [Variovorax beijingensis]RSZ40258.1 LamG domain-containing protein [Variovorax beijingensis]